TWANWERRLQRAFQDVPAWKIPGRVMGILVPANTRPDLLPMSAFGYTTLARENLATVVIILPAPADQPLNGLVMPAGKMIETSMGDFPVDTALVSELQNADLKIEASDNIFSTVSPVLESQLAEIKFIARNKMRNLKVVPIMVRFEDLNSQVK